MSDRRSCGRVSYPIQQRIRLAENHSETESTTDFGWQLFHDVSLGGCSFWSPRHLRGQRLWIELGLDGEYLTRLAEVCHKTEIQCLAHPMFLVGCRFVQPLSSSAGSAASIAQN
jgi:PilZ domain-containing protein